MTRLIAAVFPELAADPPTGWVAPMTPTEKMMDAMAMTWGDGVLETYDAARDACDFGEGAEPARDAYTKEQT